MAHPTISLHQTLHGYDDGHRLLGASLELSNDAKREMLVLSDLAGQRTGKGFDTYVTVYGLPESGLYALARTWLASEMKRPGCVWTHTLLLDFADIASIEGLQHLEKLLSRWTYPNRSRGWATYSKPLELDLTSAVSMAPLSRDIPEIASYVLSGLYGQPDSGVFVAADGSEEYQNFIFLLWLQQWPRLRCTFSFCTGVTTPRRLRGKSFDLQIAPRASFPSLRREAPDGVFVDALNANYVIAKTASAPLANAQTSPWLRRTVSDLRQFSPKLRQFLRLFGPDLAKPRAGCAALLDIFACIETINRHPDNKESERHDEYLQMLVETTASHFPSPQQGGRLKQALFGTAAPNEWLEVEETQVLKALASAPRYVAFDAPSLGIRQRSTVLWKRSHVQAEKILQELTRQGLSPFIEEVIGGVANAVSAEEALSLFRRNPTLVYPFIHHNPSLMSSPSLWQTSGNLQQELFNALERHTIDDQQRRTIAGVVFAAGAHEIATDLVERLGAAAVQGVLDQMEITPRELSLPWRRALSSHPEALSEWLSGCLNQEDNRSRFIEAALQIISLLHPHSSHTQSIDPDFWFALADIIAPRPANGTSQTGRSVNNALFFLLALALRNVGGRGNEIIERCFEVVHTDLAANTFDYFAWKWLEEMMPSLPYRDWDKCEKLRRALIDGFTRFQWPVSSFLRAVRNEETLEFVVRSCRETNQGQQLLRQIKVCVDENSIAVPEWQSDILFRRRKMRWFGFDLDFD